MIWILTAVVLLIPKKTRYFGIMLGVSLAFTFLLNDILLKNLVNRPRPYEVFPEIPMLISKLSSSSFPSGHAASSFTSAVILLRFNKRVGIPAIILAALIAFSRVFLFMHFPSDVLCGAFLGTLCAFLVLFVFRHFNFFPKLRKMC